MFGAVAAGGGFASIPQSSFTYRTVGVNIEMTPRVTYEGDIKLELSSKAARSGQRQRRRAGRALVQLPQGRRRSSACAKGSPTFSPACCVTISARP